MCNDRGADLQRRPHHRPTAACHVCTQHEERSGAAWSGAESDEPALAQRVRPTPQYEFKRGAQPRAGRAVRVNYMPPSNNGAPWGDRAAAGHGREEGGKEREREGGREGGERSEEERGRRRRQGGKGEG